MIPPAPDRWVGFACLRMANFLLGSTALDMMTSDGRVVFSDVRYKENTLSRRLRPGSYSFYVVNTPPRIEPRIEDVELDDSDYRVSGRYRQVTGNSVQLFPFPCRREEELCIPLILSGRQTQTKFRSSLLQTVSEKLLRERRIPLSFFTKNTIFFLVTTSSLFQRLIDRYSFLCHPNNGVISNYNKIYWRETEHVS